MQNSFKVKANELQTMYENIFKGEWEIKDVPFCLRTESAESVINCEALPIQCENDEDKIVIADRLFLLQKVMANVRPDHLKNLNLFVNTTVLPAKQVADVILIRYNRVMVIQFAYDMVTLPSDFAFNDNKVIYIARQIDQELKRYLPTDSVVKTYLFKIRGEKENQEEILRLSKAINQFYSKTTTKELLKLIQ